ncbi:hypothetical protein [Actinoplanes sp. NPDC049316]|uniref:hypothetical protein n=1 Tax=Actinoplanes sp. NPDC049316 TaxID=3154727 RepID=UPI0034394D84
MCDLRFAEEPITDDGDRLPVVMVPAESVRTSDRLSAIRIFLVPAFGMTGNPRSSFGPAGDGSARSALYRKGGEASHPNG